VSRTSNEISPRALRAITHKAFTFSMALMVSLALSSTLKSHPCSSYIPSQDNHSLTF
jgi:hypothetical protein